MHAGPTFQFTERQRRADKFVVSLFVPVDCL